MTCTTVRSIFHQMLSAVVLCHASGVIHRDIKLTNFIVGGTAEGFVIKLCDFGLSARASDMAENAGVYGTPPFLAPEMLHGRPYGAKVCAPLEGLHVHLTVVASGDIPGSSSHFGSWSAAVLAGALWPAFVRAGSAWRRRAALDIACLQQDALDSRRGAEGASKSRAERCRQGEAVVGRASFLPQLHADIEFLWFTHVRKSKLQKESLPEAMRKLDHDAVGRSSLTRWNSTRTSRWI